MTPKKYARNALYILSCLLISWTVLANDTMQYIDRTSANELVHDLDFQKAVYVTEAYEDTYTEQEPYEETEYYDVEIPYEEEETYTDYETEYEYRDVCEEVPYYEQKCHNENRCESVPKKTCTTRNETVCNQVPKKSCTKREVCRTLKDGSQRCRPVNDCTTSYEQVCRTRPVNDCSTTYENVCRNERVCHTETHYKTECRTETIAVQVPVTKTRIVTKYRTETRSRQVIKYRDVTKCCVTRYREVFSHNWDVSTTIKLPNNVELIGDETEKIAIEMSGLEPDAQFSVSTVHGIYRYKVAQAKKISKNKYEIQLEMTPHLTAEEIGEKFLSELKLINGEQGPVLHIEDQSFNTRVKADYQIDISEKISGEKVFSDKVTADSEKMALPVPIELKEATDYVIQLSVSKTGVIVKSAVTFKKEAEYLFKRFEESEFAENSVSDLSLNENKETLSLIFSDEGLHKEVDTAYQLTLQNLKSGETVLQKQYAPKDLQGDNNKMTITLSKAELPDEMDLKAILEVSRKSLYLENDILFEKSTIYNYAVDLEPYKNPKAIESKELIRAGKNSILKFTDTTDNIGAVDTIYVVKIQRKVFGTKTLATAKFTRSELQVGENGEVSLSLLKDIKLSEKHIKKFVNKGKVLHLHLTVQRKDMRSAGKVFAEFVAKQKFRK